MEVKDIYNAILRLKPRSAWNKGVQLYALDLLNDLNFQHDFVGSLADRKMLLNGAANWHQFSEGGCSLIYNVNIAERLCTPSELRKTHHGRKAPNANETWIDVQARALYQAERLILSIVTNH